MLTLAMSLRRADGGATTDITSLSPILEEGGRPTHMFIWILEYRSPHRACFLCFFQQHSRDGELLMLPPPHQTFVLRFVS